MFKIMVTIINVNFKFKQYFIQNEIGTAGTAYFFPLFNLKFMFIITHKLKQNN